jgi:hypothetical protein
MNTSQGLAPLQVGVVDVVSLIILSHPFPPNACAVDYRFGQWFESTMRVYANRAIRAARGHARIDKDMDVTNGPNFRFDFNRCRLDFLS